MNETEYEMTQPERSTQCLDCSGTHASATFGARRHFLKALGGFGAAAALPACTALDSGPRQKLIDTHHHFYAPAY